MQQKCWSKQRNRADHVPTIRKMGKEKNGDGVAWTDGRDSDGYRMRKRDWRRQMWRERTGRCRFENREPDSEE